MVRSTIIARTTDGLPLAASNDDDEQVRARSALSRVGLTQHQDAQGTLAEYKQQAKLIFRRVTPQSEPRCSIESGACTLQSVPPLHRTVCPS